MTEKELATRDTRSNAFQAFTRAISAIRQRPGDFGVGVAGLFDARFALAGRLYHAYARGNFFQQTELEVQKLLADGRIKEEYLGSDQAHACFSDLFDCIDRISPDPKRYEAIRAAFLNILREGNIGSSSPYPQQQLRVIYELSAGEIIVLATIYKMGGGGAVASTTWLSDVANKSGLLRTELVEEIEESLVRKRLVFQRSGLRSDLDRGQILIWGQRNRLTTLGQEICERMQRPQA